MSLPSALQRARDSGDFVSIYCDARRPQGAVQGFVDFVSHDSFLVRVVNSHGLYDGFAWRLVEDVFRVEIGGEYEQKVAYLFAAREQNHPPFLPPLDVSSDLQRETLEAAKRHELLVRIEILEKDWRDGWVESVDEETLCLKMVDCWGHQDGECVVDLETFAKINCDSANLQDSKLLTRWNEIPPSTK